MKKDDTRPREANPGQKDEEPTFDLERLKWLDPTSDERYTRNEVTLSVDASTESVLENIVRLTDQIFDHLSVLEQFPETTSRGATADPGKKVDLSSVRAGLVTAERELWKVYETARNRRQSFVKMQLEERGIDQNSSALKVHIGSGGHLFEDWLNIDAGGDELPLNVNWGLPLPDGCASFVYSAHLVEHLRYNDQAPVFLREVHRILDKGGTARIVVPDLKKLLVAYAKGDREFFKARQESYPLSEGFLQDCVATLDYILLFCGASAQILNYNHKFGYDFTSLRKMLLGAGFSEVTESDYQGSGHPELRVDDLGCNAQAKNRENQHYSLFVEATK